LETGTLVGQFALKVLHEVHYFFYNCVFATGVVFGGVLHAGDEYFGRNRCEPRRWLRNITSIAWEYDATAALFIAAVVLCLTAVSVVSVSSSAAVAQTTAATFASLSDGAACDI